MSGSDSAAAGADVPRLAGLSPPADQLLRSFEYEIGSLAAGEGMSRCTLSIILVANLKTGSWLLFPRKLWIGK